MPKVIEGNELPSDARFAIVVARYHSSITSALLDGAVGGLTAAGVSDDRIDVARVPGAWELPLVANRLARTGNYSAVICLGAVIRGDTTHDRHINRQVSLSLGEIALTHDLPVLFGVLTCQTIEQAVDRAGGPVGNKGTECAKAAIQMVRLLTAIR